MFSAIETVGRPTLLIRDNQVIGKCQVSSMRSSEVANVQMVDEAAQKLIADTQAVKIMGKIKWVSVGFHPLTGLYLGTNYTDPEDAELEKIFEDVRIVDENNLSYGMVPDTFKEVQGYRAFFNKIEKTDGTNNDSEKDIQDLKQQAIDLRDLTSTEQPIQKFTISTYHSWIEKHSEYAEHFTRCKKNLAPLEPTLYADFEDMVEAYELYSALNALGVPVFKNFMT